MDKTDETTMEFVKALIRYFSSGYVDAGKFGFSHGGTSWVCSGGTPGCFVSDGNEWRFTRFVFHSADGSMPSNLALTEPSFTVSISHKIGDEEQNLETQAALATIGIAEFLKPKVAAA